MIAINNDEDPDYSDDDDNKILMDVRRLQIFREGTGLRRPNDAI